MNSGLRDVNLTTNLLSYGMAKSEELITSTKYLIDPRLSRVGFVVQNIDTETGFL
jgi:hypothetical protein